MPSSPVRRPLQSRVGSTRFSIVREPRKLRIVKPKRYSGNKELVTVLKNEIRAARTTNRMRGQLFERLILANLRFFPHNVISLPGLRARTLAESYPTLHAKALASLLRKGKIVARKEGIVLVG